MTSFKNHLNFTESALAGLPLPEKGRTEYTDSQQRGLAVQVFPSGVKTLICRAHAFGKVLRIKLGRVGIVKIPEARVKVRALLADIDNGIDPVAKKKEQKTANITVKDFFENYYMPLHSEKYKKPKSQDKDRCLMKNNLTCIHNTPLRDLKPLILIKLHDEIGQNISVYTANRAIGLIKHMYKIAINLEILPDGFPNPATKVKMFKEEPRRRFLRLEEVDKFFKCLDGWPVAELRNFVYLALCTGGRSGSIKSLKWSNIIFDADDQGLLTFEHTKNGEDITIPLNSRTRKLLEEMKAEAEPDAIYVFPSSTSESGHLEDITRQWYKFRKAAGVPDMRVHDLRRTLGSYMAISGSNQKMVQWALGHKSSQSTNAYTWLIPNAVKTGTEKGLDYMFKDKQ